MDGWAASWIIYTWDLHNAQKECRLCLNWRVCILIWLTDLSSEMSVNAWKMRMTDLLKNDISAGLRVNHVQFKSTDLGVQG